MPLTANKQRQASGTSDFDQLLNIIEEDEKPRKKSSKGASSRSSAKGSSSSKDKAAKGKKSSSRKTSSTSSRVSKSSLSSKTGSRSSDEEVVLSSDDLADVDIVHDSAHARSRTAAHGSGGARAREAEEARHWLLDCEERDGEPTTLAGPAGGRGQRRAGARDRRRQRAAPR